MPLYIDVHRDVDASVEDVVAAHEKDVETQERYGVKYRNYWVDEDEGAVFCLFEGPSKEAGEKVHREAHGLTADEIFEVQRDEEYSPTEMLAGGARSRENPSSWRSREPFTAEASRKPTSSVVGKSAS